MYPASLFKNNSRNFHRELFYYLTGGNKCCYVVIAVDNADSKMAGKDVFQKTEMNKIYLLVTAICFSMLAESQLPCSRPAFRQFDFWVGEWEAFGPKGAKAGDSKISVILDSCVILEEWTSASSQQGLVYTGKSFNSYNAATKQWQQTWTDNTGNTTEFLRGESGNGKIVYYADKVMGQQGKIFMRRLTFTKLSDDKVRQFGERSDDEGKTWTVEYDLEYRRKK